MIAKKIVCSAIAMLLVASLAACTTTPTAGTSSQAEQQGGQTDGDSPAVSVGTLADTPSPTKDPFEKYDPPISVTTVHAENDGAFWFPEGDSIENNIYTRRYLEQLGIEYSFKWTSPGSQRTEKMNTMFASGDLPDFMSVTRQEFEKLHAAGSLEDLTVPLVEYASEYTRQYLTGDFQFLLDVATKDGRYYGITNGFSYQDGGEMIWIRKDWLTKLGLETPKTLADLENVMEQFTKNNPAGFSETDAYALGGFAATQQPWEWTMDIAFYNMFGSYPGRNMAMWYENSKGELEHGMFGSETKDNTRAALVKAHEYYEKGYLPTSLPAMSYDMRNEDVFNGKCGIFTGDVWGAYWPLILHKDMDPEADWIPVPILTGDGSLGKVSRDVANVENILVARKGVEHPEALVKMTNLYHDLNNNPETMEFAEFNTVPADSNQIFLSYSLRMYNPAFNYEGYQQISAAQKSGDFDNLCEAYKMFYDQAMDYEATGDAGGWSPYRSYLQGETSLSVIDEYVQNKRIVFREYTDEPTEFMIENEPTVKKMWDSMAISIITGASDISAYDDFLTSWDTIYGDTAAKEVNDWFTARGGKSIQSELG